MLLLHHAPLIFQGAEHESLRSQYAREPATGCVGLFFVAIRVMVAEPYNPHVFESGAVRRSVPLDGRSTNRPSQRPGSGTSLRGDPGHGLIRNQGSLPGGRAAWKD